MAETAEEPVEQSVEDRLVSVLTDGEFDEPEQEEPVEAKEPEEQPAEVKAEEEDDEPTEGESEFVEVEYDGKLYEVPTELKDALMLQSDYTQKTQTVSADRKEIEVVRGDLEKTKAQYDFAISVQDDVLQAQQLETDIGNYQEYLRTYVNDPNFSLQEAEKIRIAVDDARTKRDKIVSEVTTKQQEFQQAQEQSHQELLDKGTDVLKQRITGWGESHQKQVREYAQTVGFSDQEIAGVVDPRQAEVLWKASQYDLLKAGVAPAVKKVHDAPAIKPKARNTMDQAAKDRLALNKIKKAKNQSSAKKAKAIMESDSVLDRFM